MMTKLTILYRVCDCVDMLHTTPSEGKHAQNRNSARFYDVPKPLLIRKCLPSVVDGLRLVDSLPHENRIAVEFICVHDRCSRETLEFIKEMLPEAKFVPCDGSGNGDSFATCVNIAANMADDDTMVMFLEDDYTFLSSDALFKATLMLEALKVRVGGYCALFTDDYPDRYDGRGFRENTTVAVTPFGHAMRIDSSTCTFTTYVGAIRENVDSLMKFKGYPEVMESGSVDLMWKKVPLWCPLPALTLHCQLRTHAPQYLDANSLKAAIEA